MYLQLNIGVSKSKASKISIRCGSVEDVDPINPPHCCACPHPRSGFSTSYIMVFWVVFFLCSVNLNER